MIGLADKSFDQSVLLSLLRYDAESGALYWMERDPNWFEPSASGRTPEAQARIWNKKHAGKEAICTLDQKGYLIGTVLGHRAKAHRLIWIMQTGVNPVQIDHINGRRSDNRLANLRAADNTVNSQNRKRRVDNKSGHIGVYFDSRSSTWWAEITVSGHTTRLGRFSDISDAVAARKEAEKRLGFHPNHGR